MIQLRAIFARLEIPRTNPVRNNNNVAHGERSTCCDQAGRACGLTTGVKRVRCFTELSKIHNIQQTRTKNSIASQCVLGAAETREKRRSGMNFSNLRNHQN